MRFTFLALPALAVAAALTLVGCATSAGAGQSGTDATAHSGLKVVATTTQVADFARAVIGDAPGVNLTQLIKPNQSAHSYDPSVADLAALGHADVLVINGVGLEEWLTDAIDASGFHGITVDSDEGIAIETSGAENDPGHAADAAHGQADAAHADAAHDHTAGNPHIWTSVDNARVMVNTIAAGLEKADPASAPAFTANAAAYDIRLAALDGWIRSNIDQVPAAERLLVSNHDAFGYFTAAYGITYVGSIMPSFDDNAEPSAAAIDALVASIRKTA